MSMTKFNLLPNTPLSAFTLNTSASYFGFDTSDDPFIFATTGNSQTDIEAATTRSFDIFVPVASSDIKPNEGTDIRGNHEGDDARWAPVNNEGDDTRGDGSEGGGNVIQPNQGDDGIRTPERCDGIPLPVEQPPIKCEGFPAPFKPNMGDDGKTDGTPGTIFPEYVGPAVELPSNGPCQGYVGSVRPDDKPGTTPELPKELPDDTTVTTDVVCVMKPPVLDISKVVCDMPLPKTGTGFDLKTWFGDDTIAFQPKTDGSTDFGGPCQGPNENVTTEPACVFPDYTPSVRPDADVVDTFDGSYHAPVESGFAFL